MFRTRIIALLLPLVVFCSGPILWSQKPQDSLLLITGGGTPGSTEFTTELGSDSVLRVTRKGFPITANGNLTETSSSIKLLPKESHRILLLANNATDFSVKSPGVFADGTNAGMRLVFNGETIRRTCSNEPRWPVGQKTQALLLEINKHLPKEMQIF